MKNKSLETLNILNSFQVIVICWQIAIMLELLP
jgi:hypothetical protein